MTNLFRGDNSIRAPLPMTTKDAKQKAARIWGKGVDCFWVGGTAFIRVDGKFVGSGQTWEAAFEDAGF